MSITNINRENEALLTLRELKRLFRYDPLTGKFTRLVSMGTRGRIGDIVGSLRKPSGYVTITVNSRGYYAHRLAWLYMTGEWPESLIDHVDEVKSNNIWNNLRESTHSQNMCNSSLQTNNTSGYKGVSWYKATSRWRVAIDIEGSKKHLGYFKDVEEAAQAYKEASEELHKEFSNHG